MTETKTTAKEAKRLRKSVKNRRHYADNLRKTAKEMRESAQTSGDEGEALFAARIDALADAELAAAREEEAKAATAEKPGMLNSMFGGYSSAEMKMRSERASAAIRGRMSGDRILHLLQHYGIERSGDNHVDMKAVEARLELTAQVSPPGEPRMQLGKRIELAETTLYGKPRF